MAQGTRFDTLLNQVQRRLETIENMCDEFSQISLDQKKQTIPKGNRELQIVQTNISEMEKLIQTMPMRDREFFTEDLLNCRDSHSKLTNKIKEFDEEVQRLILLDKAKREESLNREQLERDNQILTGIHDNLELEKKLGSDTLSTKDETLNTLAEDREHLENIDTNIDIIDEEAEKGLAAAGRMLKRAFFNGCITWSIVILLILLDIFIIYLKFF